MNTPNLYAFIGNTQDVSAKIMSETKKIYPADGAICLHLDETSDMDKTIRAAKVSIQRTKNGLNKKQANIYAVVKAHDRLGAQFVLAAGKRLSALFAEDFVAYRLTLAIFLSESNEPDVDGISFEMRSKFTYEFLMMMAGHTPFDCIFLLSDRNEYGQVDPINYGNVCKFLARLPQTCVKSRFVETLAMKAGEAGRTLFASGGFWEKEMPDDQPNRKLYQLAEVLENELAEGEKISIQSDEILAINKEERHPFSVFNQSSFRNSHTDTKIIADICSVAAKPLSSLQLNGMTVKEAETLLFGDNAVRFFEINYPQHEEQLQYQEHLPLRNAVAKERQLRHRLDNLSAEIAWTSQELAQLEVTTHKIGIFDMLEYIKKPRKWSPFVDKIKNAIGNCYALKHRLNVLRITQKNTTEVHSLFSDYINHIRNIITTIKEQEPLPSQANAAVVQEFNQDTHSLDEESILPTKHAVLNISLLRDDGLLHETHMPSEEANPYILRLIGGFAPEDLARYHAIREISKIK